MKKASETQTTEVNDELRPEYDLRKLFKNGVRGKHAARYKQGTNLVLLDPDIAAAFPDALSVNNALRLVLQLKAIPTTSSLEPVKA